MIALPQHPPTATSTLFANIDPAPHQLDVNIDEQLTSSMADRTTR